MFSYNWDWTIVWDYREVLVQSLALAIRIALVSSLFGTVLGILAGTFLAVQHAYLAFPRLMLALVVDFVRSLPALILILFLYYWLPYATPVSSAEAAVVVALSVNLSAFIADVVRGAIEGVPKPLIDAGYALGMTPPLVTYRIILPTALRQLLPTFVLLYIDVLKLTALASVVGVKELVFVATEISTMRYRYLELYSAMALLYAAIIMPLALLARNLERSPWLIRRT